MRTSFPWLALIETPQREQDLTSLAPQRGLIAAQPVEGIGRQVGKSDKGAREIIRLIGRLRGRSRVGIETAGDFVFILRHVFLGRDGIPVHAVDDLLARLMSLASLPELQQVPGLYLEQAALDRGGTTQPP